MSIYCDIVALLVSIYHDYIFLISPSTNSKYTHFAWINTPREEGGLKGLQIPLLSDLTKQISKDYGVLLENEGHTLRLTD